MSVGVETWPPAKRLPTIEIVGVQVTSWSYGSHSEVPTSVRIDTSVAGVVFRCEWTIFAGGGEPQPDTTDDLPPAAYEAVRSILIDEWHRAMQGERDFWITR